MKKFFVVLAAFIFSMSLLGTSALALESTGDSVFDSFINDSRFTNGVSWGNIGPKISPYSCAQCCAYAADFVKYCYGKDNPRNGTVFYDAWETQAGDIITLGNPSNGAGHWFVVLKRSGNDLYVAEGNFAGKVRIGWNYSIASGNKFNGDYYNRTFTAGYHHGNAAPIPTTPPEPTPTPDPNAPKEYYYASFPSGFNTGCDLYNKYNKEQLKGYNDGTTKREVSEPQFYTYIYWHWCWYTGALSSNNYNVYVNDYYGTVNGRNYQYFSAFESSEEYSHTDRDGAYDSQVFYHWRGNTADGSWWWYRIPVYKQTYKDTTSSLKISSQPVSKSVDENTSASFSVSASGDGLKYQWQNKLVGTDTWSDYYSGTGATLTVPYSSAYNGSSFRCKLTDENGFTLISNEAVLTYKKLGPDIVITKQPVSTSVNPNVVASFKLTATGENLTYLWQYKLAGSSTWVDWITKTTPSITVAYQENRDGMSLRCQLRDGYGKTATSNTVTLAYNKIGPVITKQPESATVSEGEIASFSLKATGSKLKYLWQYRYAGSNSWVDWTTKTTASITVAYSASRNGMSLRCKITDGDGKTEVSDQVTLKYSAKGPSFTSQPVSTSVESGTIASFSVKATGTKLTYLWQYKKAGASSWTDWTTKTTAAITVAYDKSRDGMSLRCKITDGNGKTAYSNTATLTYKAAAPKFTKQPANASVASGELASFSVTATGTKLTYLWQYKKAGASTWTDWTTKTTAAITVAYDKSRDGMSLRCRVKDGNGTTVYSNAVTLTYKTSGPAITKHPANTTVPADEYAVFSVNATGTNLKYLWQYKNAGSSTWVDWTSKTTSVITVAYSSSRNGMQVRCKVTDGNGKSVYSNTATLTYSK